MNRLETDKKQPKLPLDMGEPKPFSQPWQAQAFALVVALHEKEMFTWNEWADALSSVLKQPDVAADGSDYYACWLRALEGLISKKDIAGTGEIDDLAASWARAAHATPHGMPILLENDPHGYPKGL